MHAVISSHGRDAVFPPGVDVSACIPAQANVYVELTFEGSEPFILLGTCVFSTPSTGGVVC